MTSTKSMESIQGETEKPFRAPGLDNRTNHIGPRRRPRGQASTTLVCSCSCGTEFHRRRNKVNPHGINYLSAKHDTRCKAGVDVYGAPLGSAVTDGVKQPFLFLLSDHSRESKSETEGVEADLRSIYGRLPTESRLWLLLRGAGHYGFSDLGPIPVQIAHWLHIVSLDRQRQILITRDCLRTFFDVYLKGAPASALHDLQEYPEIETGP